MPWLIADNGVRNPQRLRDGLEVLVNSEFHGDFSKKNEEGMALLLDKEGIISLQTNTDNTVSRKWRLNLIRLGFINNETHTITDNGRRLIHTSSLPEQEDCFLRALLIHQLPSPIHPMPWGDIDHPINPLRMVLSVLVGLEELGQDSTISKNEMASIVMIHYNMTDIPHIVNEIIHYRKLKQKATGRVRQFEKEYREKASKIDGGRVSSESLNSYADVNIRYLKLTGLFEEEGISGLSIAEHKKTIVKQILEIPFKPVSQEDYQRALGQGASLPTDKKHEAITAIRNLFDLLVQHNATIEPLPEGWEHMDIADLSIIRIRLENEWIHNQERQYAIRQKDEWEDILKYMTELQQPSRIGKRNSLIPSGEGPAYLEWAIWRAFLAINSLHNEPWESRKFPVDRTFKPVRHAPSGDADMVFEFKDFVFVVEVTLTTSSRQEAAEGEPVRRHVAQYVDKFSVLGKRVFGVFIANKIDTNTAETFRIGVWYRNDDSQMSVNIVPITLEDFTKTFKTIFQDGFYENAEEFLKQLVIELRSYSNERAPEWKLLIKESFENRINYLSNLKSDK